LYGFTGAEREADTDLGATRHGARWLSSSGGRWLSADPLFLQNPKKSVESPLEMGLYAYAMNNPVAFVDSTGTETTVMVTEGEITGIGTHAAMYVTRGGGDSGKDPFLFDPNGGYRPLQITREKTHESQPVPYGPIFEHWSTKPERVPRSSLIGRSDVFEKNLSYDNAGDNNPLKTRTILWDVLDFKRYHNRDGDVVFEISFDTTLDEEKKLHAAALEYNPNGTSFYCAEAVANVLAQLPRFAGLSEDTMPGNLKDNLMDYSPKRAKTASEPPFDPAFSMKTVKEQVEKR
jgi:RHS repeat-associated protein